LGIEGCRLKVAGYKLQVDRGRGTADRGTPSRSIRSAVERPGGRSASVSTPKPLRPDSAPGASSPSVYRRIRSCPPGTLQSRYAALRWIAPRPLRPPNPLKGALMAEVSGLPTRGRAPAERPARYPPPTPSANGRTDSSRGQTRRGKERGLVVSEASRIPKAPP
jgi:hypothetical protein